MSDPVALVCVSDADRDNASAQRWRRRTSATHSVWVGVDGAAARPVPRRSWRVRIVVAAVLLGGAGSLGLGAALSHSGDSVFSRRLALGCEEIEPCLTLEAEAERRMDGCSLLCARAEAELTAARQMRFRAEERRAVREHYRERSRSEQAELQRQRAERDDEWQRERAARAQEASRARQHQLELERLRQEHVERRIADERRRRVAYFTALGEKGRLLRLTRCLERSERCDALVLDLLEAARTDAERLALAEANERIVRPAAKPKEPAAPKHDGGDPETSSASAAEPAKPALTPVPADDAMMPPSS